jgi:hypothetical protein
LSTEFDRRAIDEQFKRDLVKQLTAIETRQEMFNKTVESMRGEMTQLNSHYLTLHEVLFGGPTGDSVGLLEKHRILRRNWTIAIAVVVFLANVFGEVAKKQLDKYMAYVQSQSVAEQWKAEKSRPHIRHYTIINKIQPEEKSEDKSDDKSQ